MPEQIKRMPFQEWYKTVPEDKKDTMNYRLRYAYENDLIPQDQLDEFVNNKDAHLMSAYYNKKTGNYDFIKSKNHPTFHMEIDWYKSKDAAKFRREYDYVESEDSDFPSYVKKKNKALNKYDKGASKIGATEHDKSRYDALNSEFSETKKDYINKLNTDDHRDEVVTEKYGYSGPDRYLRDLKNSLYGGDKSPWNPTKKEIDQIIEREKWNVKNTHLSKYLPGPMAAGSLNPKTLMIKSRSDGSGNRGNFWHELTHSTEADKFSDQAYPSDFKNAYIEGHFEGTKRIQDISKYKPVLEGKYDIAEKEFNDIIDRDMREYYDEWKGYIKHKNENKMYRFSELPDDYQSFLFDITGAIKNRNHDKMGIGASGQDLFSDKFRSKMSAMSSNYLLDLEHPRAMASDTGKNYYNSPAEIKANIATLKDEMNSLGITGKDPLIGGKKHYRKEHIDDFLKRAKSSSSKDTLNTLQSFLKVDYDELVRWLNGDFSVK